MTTPLIARDLVREHFEEAVLTEKRSTGWDVSSSVVTVEVQ